MYQNKKQKYKKYYRLSQLLLVSLLLTNFFILPTKAEEDVTILNQQIEQKRREIDVLQKEIDAYAEQIKIKQQEARGLQNQISIIDNQIAKINLDIESTNIRIEENQLAIQAANLEIKVLENRIKDQKAKISEYLRLIHRNDQISPLEIVLNHDSFSDFFDQIKYTEEIHNDLKNALSGLKNEKINFEKEKNDLEGKIKLENELKDQLQSQRSELEERNTAQGMLLVQARLTQKQYQNYQYQLQLEQQQANSEISSIEKTIRAELEQRELAERFKDFGDARLAWPLDHSRGISAYFHDPDYPFRYIFEHPAIDIRAYQGTTLTAAESGYVARVKFAGDSSYAYIMLIHNNDISTVYGHVSKPLVKEDQYVTKGQAIALSGGMPGTPGSGNLSTGPHLHFEVRLGGIPVNPLEYLP